MLILGRASQIAVDMKDGDDSDDVAAGDGCADGYQEYEPTRA